MVSLLILYVNTFVRTQLESFSNVYVKRQPSFLRIRSQPHRAKSEAIVFTSILR